MMFALEVEYLTGRAVASQRHDREAAEWPPHPGRLFSALVAALKECDFGESERQALLWLERQRPPALSYSDAYLRDVVPVFVPVNDTTAPDKVPAKGFSIGQIAEGIRVMPERRSRQQRAFPSATPQDRIVHFIWSHAAAEEVTRHRPALMRLAANVTYLGHSSSLVRVAVCDEPPRATLEPAEVGNEVLRIPTPGRLEELESTYLRGARPSPGMYCAYTRALDVVAKESPETVFGEMVIFRRMRGQRLPLHAFGNLMRAVRGALLALAKPQPQEIISGHLPDGRPSQRPHIAIIPLANVSLHNLYADGDMMGFAVILPRRLIRFSDPERRHVMQALTQLQQVTMGRAGAWHVERLTAEASQKSLQGAEYSEPARRWATVTPMVLDYVPKDRPDRDLQSIVRLACERIGLPAHASIQVGQVSPFRGVPPSGHFQPVANGKQLRLPWTHVTVEFRQPVRGPIILGARRYLGYGLCRHYPERRERRDA
jgi:CRISPR-associated protein Csb2